jgi:hypothetical protein
MLKATDEGFRLVSAYLESAVVARWLKASLTLIQTVSAVL